MVGPYLVITLMQLLNQMVYPPRPNFARASWSPIGTGSSMQTRVAPRTISPRTLIMPLRNISWRNLTSTLRTSITSARDFPSPTTHLDVEPQRLQTPTPTFFRISPSNLENTWQDGNRGGLGLTSHAPSWIQRGGDHLSLGGLIIYQQGHRIHCWCIAEL